LQNKENKDAWYIQFKNCAQIIANEIDGVINIFGVAVQNGINYSHSVLFAKCEIVRYGRIKISESQQIQYL